MSCSVFIKFAGSDSSVRYRTNSPQETAERWVRHAMDASAPARPYTFEGLTFDGREVLINWSHVDAVYVTVDVIPDADLDSTGKQTPSWLPSARAEPDEQSWPPPRRSAMAPRL